MFVTMANRSLILGIETSCDDTAAAIVAADGTIISHVVHSQVASHQPYGGVVPEIAARSHGVVLPQLVRQVLTEAALDLSALAGVAVTAGPGLIGGLLVGVTTARCLGLAAGLPVMTVNHLEAHALVPRLQRPIPFPYLLLLLSGGHSFFALINGVGQYQLLGETLDDAVGEAFDKVAKLLGLPYPGGPALETLARDGNATRFTLPRPMLGRAGCDLSLAGLKTATRLLIQQQAPLDDSARAAVASAFQQAVVAMLVDRFDHAVAAVPHVRHAVVAGGVAANQFIKHQLQTAADKHGVELVYPPPSLCTDNAVMVAWAAHERLAAGAGYGQATPPRPRWPLNEVTLC